MLTLTGTWTFLNISAPLCASNKATSCGVETITAPGKTKQEILLKCVLLMILLNIFII